MGSARFFEEHSVPAQVLLESLPGGIALIDEHGVIGDLNHRLADMTGYEVDELLGRDIQILIPTTQEGSDFDLREEIVSAPENGI